MSLDATPNTTNPQYQNWLSRLTDNEIPIFGRTAQDIVNVSSNQVSSAVHLGHVVLKDASMTARILKLANSVLYNTTGRKFSTITHAIMMLGFTTVRNMSLTLSLVDSIEHGTHRDNLIKQMARSIHAATQAQEMARLMDDPKHEEVFIAALLYHIGDLAYWCVADETGEALSAALQNPNYTHDEAEELILGFTLRDMSSSIAQKWGLSDLLKKTLDTTEPTEPSSKAITLSHEFAIAVEEGWDTEKVAELTINIAELTNTSEENIIEHLKEQTSKSADITRAFGGKSIADAIPLVRSTSKVAGPIIDTEQEVDITPGFFQPDNQLQLQILQDLMTVSKEKTDFNVLIEMSLEGISRGIGMDHALFALLTPNRKELKVKQVIGDNSDWLKEHFKFALNSPESSIWLHVFKEGCAMQIDRTSPVDIKRLIPQSLSKKIKSSTFLVAPVIVKNKPIGLLYADQSVSKRALNDENFNGFQLFSQQVNMVLNRAMAR